LNNSKLYHPIKIKDVLIDGNLFLAPLAGYTDIPKGLQEEIEKQQN